MILNRAAAKERTGRKLKYARIHLDELSNYHNYTGNDDWENAHQESFLFHLVGSIENFLHEINLCYSLNLDIKDVNWNSISKKLSVNSLNSSAFTFLLNLKKDKNNWMYLLYEMRNHSAHRGRIGKIINFSTDERLDNEFRIPSTGEPQKIYPGLKCLELYEKIFNNVELLIQECRENDPRLGE